MAYRWQDDLERLETKYKIPRGLLGALVRAESGGRQNVRSSAGAIGLTQLMPGTARGLGVDPNDPRQNLEGGAKYLSQQLRAFRGNVNKALAAYNAGPGAVRKYGGIPPYDETKTYVSRVNNFWKESSNYPSASSGVRFNVPGALPEPKRKLHPGLEPERIAAVQQAFNPANAAAVLQGRQKIQNQWDREYNRQRIAYEARQRQIESARAANEAEIASSMTGDEQALGPYVPFNEGSKFVKTPYGWVRNVREGEQSYKFLQRLGSAFGLRNDPGNYQTTGGQHEADSLHYEGRAIDYGDARNQRRQLITFSNWLKRHSPYISELYYNPLGWGIRGGRVVRGLRQPGHDDHLHIGWRR